MSSTYYDSDLSAAQIDQALHAIDRVIAPANNGKILVVDNGHITAKTAQEIKINPTMISKVITENGLYLPADDDADAYDRVQVYVSEGGGGNDVPVRKVGHYGNNVAYTSQYIYTLPYTFLEFVGWTAIAVIMHRSSIDYVHSGWSLVHTIDVSRSSNIQYISIYKKLITNPNDIIHVQQSNSSARISMSVIASPVDVTVEYLNTVSCTEQSSGTVSGVNDLFVADVNSYGFKLLVYDSYMQPTSGFSIPYINTSNPIVLCTGNYFCQPANNYSAAISDMGSALRHYVGVCNFGSAGTIKMGEQFTSTGAGTESFQPASPPAGAFDSQILVYDLSFGGSDDED